MESTFSPPFTDAVKAASKDAQKLSKDIRGDISDAVSRGRDIAGDLASGTRDAAGDLAQRGQAAAERARGYFSEGRERLSKAADRVSGYADDNTALVALAALGIGLLLGHLVTRRSR